MDTMFGWIEILRRVRGGHDFLHSCILFYTIMGPVSHFDITAVFLFLLLIILIIIMYSPKHLRVHKFANQTFTVHQGGMSK